jgi:hypothetical protein
MLDNTNSLPFIYLVTPPQMANTIGSTASTTLIMQADSRFELIGIFGATDQANERTDVNPNYFACTIRDQTTGRDLMSGPVPQRVLCGNAFNGFLQKRGIVFEPQSNLLFTFTNLVNATNNVTLALHGYKMIL